MRRGSPLQAPSLRTGGLKIARCQSLLQMLGDQIGRERLKIFTIDLIGARNGRQPNA